MTPDALARLQARAYRHMSPWSAADFEALLATPGVLLVAEESGFLLARIVADEAEILALATDPERQRQGVARGLLDRFLQAAAAQGVVQVFLEVAAENEGARAFYRHQGFAETGRRKGYYRKPDGGRDDAVIMMRALTQGHAT